MKLTPDERKTKRLQLLIRPSLYDKLQDLKELSGLSVNEIVSQILSEQVDQLIASYKMPDIIHVQDDAAAGKDIS